MTDIIAAMDETAVNQVLPVAEATLGIVTGTGSSSLGPITVQHGASGWFSGGVAHLFPPDIVRIAECTLHYDTHLTLLFDLSSIIPDIHFPGIKIKIFKKWVVIVPAFTINWPTVKIPVSHSGTLVFTGTFRLQTVFVNPNWRVNAVIQSVPLLQLTPAASLLIGLIGVAAGVALAGIPFIGLYLAGAVIGITAAIGIAGATGLLGLMLTPLVSGAVFPLYSQPKHFPLLPAAGALDPAVYINLASVGAFVINSGEPELKLLTDITP
jgi:hypothetical protein